MRSLQVRFSLVILALGLLTPPTWARDAARDLRRMIAYTIIAATAVSEVSEARDGSKYIRLANGVVFKVAFLLLDPLPLTDVIVFAKPLSAELRQQFQGKVPDVLLNSYRVLIDNEAYDAEPVVPR